MRPLFVPLLLAAALAFGIIAHPPEPPRIADPAGDLLAAIDPALLAPLSQRQRLQLRHHAKRLTAARPRAGRCWAPGTDPAVIEAFLAVEQARRAMDRGRRDDDGPAEANQLDIRWSTTATNGSSQGTQGLPITLTWSFVPDGTPIPGDTGIGDPAGPSDLRAFLSNIYGGTPSGPPHQQPWFIHFQNVFDSIAAKTGVTYVYEPNDDSATMSFAQPGALDIRGDIRIGGHDFAEPEGSSGTLAYNFFPNDGDMVIDTSDDWFEDNKTSPNHLGNLLEHEHGHGLGLNHVCPANGTKLMEPFITTGFDGIQFDDIYSLQRHYGDFYEKHSSTRNNDSAVAAAPLNVVPGTPFSTEWVSIDDDGDTDHYRFSVPAGALITARAVPSTASYLEGPQTTNCSGTTAFDSSAIHNLDLTLIDPDQSTVLATANTNPAGQTEEITSFTATSGGFHYLKVNGDFTNATQLYRLEVEVIIPAVNIVIAEHPVVLESFAGNNGGPDPGETVQIDLTLANTGLIDATNAQAVLTGPAGFTGFTTSATYGPLDAGTDATRSFVFALEGACGDTLDLNLAVTADGGYMVDLPLPITLGVPTDALDASFDAESLPPGWTSTTSGVGAGWVTSTTLPATGPRSAFTPNAADVGESILTSPSVTLGVGDSTLTFNHAHNTEAGTTAAYDGGVLEISINGEPWADILNAGGSFQSGGYNRTLASSFNNPLDGRDAWSGDSGGHITTTVSLPAAAANLPVQLRWILGSDESKGDEGWFIDDVSLFTNLCDLPIPTLMVTVDDPSTSEFTPLDLAGLTLTVPLPPLHPTPLVPTNSGSADLDLDVTGLHLIVFPASQTTLSLPIQAVNDSLIEGDETLVLAFPGAPGSSTITIQDTPYGQWAATQIGPGPLNGPLDDFDGDRASNLAEYAHPDPAASSARPDLQPRFDGPFFRIDAPLPILPPDVLIGAESSQNLENWSPTGVQPLPDGFQIPAGPADPTPFFLRLTYDLLPAAP